MTISTQNRTAGPFAGNGVTAAFPFTFKVFQASDLKVVRRVDSTEVETVLVLNTNYTVALNPNQNANPGGIVTLTGALAVGQTLTVTTELAYLQQTELTNQGGFYPQVITNAFDRQTVFSQQLAQAVSRALKYPLSDTGVDPTLPGRNALRGRVLAFHETTGRPIVGPSVASLGTVAGGITAIQTVADNIGDVNTVADNIGDVNTVGQNIADVNDVADSLPAIQTVATNIGDVQTVAANINDVTNFADVYLGPLSADPSTRTDGSALVQGDLYFNTTTNRLRVYTGSRWSEANTGTVSVQQFTGDGVTVDFLLNGAPDNENVVQVFVGGVYQSKTVYDITGPNSDILTFTSPPPNGAAIEAVTFSVLPLGVVDASQVHMPGGGTLDGLSAANSTTLVAGIAAKYLGRAVLASTFATPNVTTDQSTQLQAAWQFAADNKIPFVVDGVYWVGLNAFNPPTIGANRPTALHVVSNSEVYFTPSAAIKLLPNAEPVHYVLNFYTAQNVKMYNPVVYGDRFTHTGVGGESGNCYNIVTCKNIYLHKPKAYDAWGDGFYIGREFFTNIPDPVEFVTLFEPEGYNSSRNDISLCHGHDINIVRPLTSGAGRTAPGAGIDIEPEFGNNVAVEPTLKRVTIDSPKSIGKTSGILMAFFRPIGDWDVSVTGCAVDYDSSTPLQLIRSEAAINSQGVLTIDNFKSFNCFGNPMAHNWFADGKCFVDIGSFTHSRANRTNDAAYRHAIEISRDGSVSGELTIQRFINAGSPNCLEPFRVSDATTLQNTKIDFISQGRSNNGGVVSATALIDRSCKLNTERRNLSLTGLSSQTFFNTDYDVNTSGGNVSFEVSGNVKATQRFMKAASANSLTLTASLTKAIVKPDGSAVSSYTATAVGSYIELMDDDSGNKIVINQRGNWV